MHCSFFALLGALGRSGNLKPFSLSLGFLGFAGGGKWFGVERDGHDYDDAVFLALQFFCIAVFFALQLFVLSFSFLESLSLGSAGGDLG